MTNSHTQVRWEGEPVDGIVPDPEACALFTCDEFAFGVDLPPGTWSRSGGLQVGIRWEDENQDLDLYVYGPGGDLAASSVGIVSTAESVFVERATDGNYRALVVPATTDEPTSYEGVAEVEYSTRAMPVRELLPDLQSLAPRNLRVQTSAYLFELPVPSTPTGCYPEETLEQGAMRCLRFDQIIGNYGNGPLELRYVLDSVADDQRLEQRIYNSDGTFTDRLADHYEFHPAHAHFHYANFAQSFLYFSDATGERGELARAGKKNGFCLVDVENTRFGEKGDSARTYIPPSCLLPNDEGVAVNGISVGWADVYNWFLADQFIEITHLPDGYYILETVADPGRDDPGGTLRELDESNNSNSVLIQLCEEGTQGEIVGQDEDLCP